MDELILCRCYLRGWRTLCSFSFKTNYLSTLSLRIDYALWIALHASWPPDKLLSPVLMSCDSALDMVPLLAARRRCRDGPDNPESTTDKDVSLQDLNAQSASLSMFSLAHQNLLQDLSHAASPMQLICVRVHQ